jgi:hypothetical protein
MGRLFRPLMRRSHIATSASISFPSSAEILVIPIVWVPERPLQPNKRLVGEAQSPGDCAASWRWKERREQMSDFSVRSGGIDYADDDSRQRCRKWAKLPVGKRLDIAAERVLGGS